MLLIYFIGTICNVFPNEFKIFNTVESCGSDVPFSILEITGCLIPLIASSCFCVIPFSSLAFIISLMIATRTSLSVDVSLIATKR